jgi:hypothetical protein
MIGTTGFEPAILDRLNWTVFEPRDGRNHRATASPATVFAVRDLEAAMTFYLIEQRNVRWRVSPELRRTCLNAQRGMSD